MIRDRIRIATMGAVVASAACWMSVYSVAAEAKPEAAPVMIHVSPMGDDHAAGDAAAPLKSLEAARDHVRELRKAGKVTGPVDVILHDGVYRLDHTFTLTKGDSGTADAPVNYRAADGATPRLFGGSVVDHFAPLKDDAVLKRLDEAARSHVLVADLPDTGKHHHGEGPHGWCELFFDGKPMTLARYPNAGWMTIQSVPHDSDKPTFTYLGDRPARWRDEADACVYGFWYHNWADEYLPVASIDPDHHAITTTRAHGYGFRHGGRFIGINLLCELDCPAEYYIDYDAGKLYFWPPKSVDSGRAFVTRLNRPLIELNNASHITFAGLTIEGGRGEGVMVRNGESITVQHCTVCNLGDGGVVIEGGHHNRVIACNLSQLGGGGVGLSGGDRKSLTPSGNEAVDNRIVDFARVYHTYHAGIHLYGVGNRAAHNLIAYSPHSAILYGGNDNIIEYNEIHHVLLGTDDAGAIYTGRNWTYHGNVERYNYIHDCGPAAAPKPEQPMPDVPGIVAGPSSKFGANLIYLDDCVSGIEVYGNILVGGDRAVLLGGGRDNIIRNNICIANHMGVWIDARGLGWAAKYAKKGGGWQMYKKLDEIGYDRPPYSDRFPKLAAIMKGNPPAPEGDVVERNIFINVHQPVALHGPKPGDIQQADNLTDVKMDDADSANPLDLVRRIDPKLMQQIHFELIDLDKIGPRKSGK